MKRIIVASNNEHKIKEIKEIIEHLPYEVVSLKEAGIDIDVDEDGTTFMENAYKKASEIYKLNKDSMVLADDSGLAVDILSGAPGVYSARFAGEHGNDKKNNDKLIGLLSGKNFEERRAKFICAIILIVDDNKVIKVQGETDGYITESERGKDGFGYDPLFYVPQFNKTFAEMTSKEKNSISHRGKALKMLEENLRTIT
ncbi:MAG: XTP/dITP diphosphatase [Bacillota bacterium]|nr:XTP/dITP diphosphatase [Bacillota bacterium]